MNQETLERLTVLNTGLLVILVWRVFISSPEPAQLMSDELHQRATALQQQGGSPLEAPVKEQRPIPSMGEPLMGGGAQNYAELLTQTLEPLERAYAEHGEKGSMPSDEQLNAAIATNRLDSEESKVVLKILEAGYVRFNMPFPKLEIPTGRVGSGKTMVPEQHDAPENAEGPRLDEWLRRTTDTLATELKANKESPAGLVPTEQELQAAIESNSLISEESRLVVDMLKNGYARLKMDFPAYGVTHSEVLEKTEASFEETSTEQSKSIRQQVSQQRILQAYFKGQLQRLRLEANSQNRNLEALLPTDAQVQAAVESGSLKTEEARMVIASIEQCYGELGLTFYSPPTGE